MKIKFEWHSAHTTEQKKEIEENVNREISEESIKKNIKKITRVFV